MPHSGLCHIATVQLCNFHQKGIITMAAESVITLYQEWRTQRIPYERLLGQFAQHLSTADYVIPLQSQQLEEQACQIGELELAVEKLIDRLTVVQERRGCA